ncbi:MAG TPA: hypothetical protein VG897_01440 [Terriglobales bacterium]|nr:hypothetical protein [Terriglobales bacterium]
MIQVHLVALFMICAVTMQGQDNARAVRLGELTIDGPIDKVFPLFTPEGETLWIPSWKWTPIYPAGKETVRDMVFRTDEDTLWTLAVYEPPRRSVYVHTSPDLLARIEVVCEAIDANHTKMNITWVMTAINEHGQMIIEHHQTEAENAKRMERWKKWLDEYAVKEGWSK